MKTLPSEVDQCLDKRDIHLPSVHLTFSLMQDGYCIGAMRRKAQARISKDTDSAWPLSRIFRDKRQVAFMSREGHACDFLPIAMKETAQEGS
jgi:hypothetical protein